MTLTGKPEVIQRLIGFGKVGTAARLCNRDKNIGQYKQHELFSL